MLISSGKERISLHLDDAAESLRSFSLGEHQIHPDGWESESMASPPPPFAAIFTNVNIVPDHEMSELEKSIFLIKKKSRQRSISHLEGEIAQLRQQERVLNQRRREALDRILEIKGCIRVFCRVTPLLSTERTTKESISIGSEKVTVRSAGNRKEYKFDKLFDQKATQEDVFVEVEPILRSALDGHNACILAYGQTGTGKTFTMDGNDDEPGIIPRALDKLFSYTSLEECSSVTYSMSMLEVYMGGLRDLLVPKVACRTYEPAAKCNLNIQTDPKGLVEIEGLTDVQISDVAQAKLWYLKGRRARSTSWTNVNEMSSRSHCLMKITISRHGDDLNAKAPEVSKLWMVDLGGSERLLKTGATGQTLEEGRSINISLSALSDVVAALRRRGSHVPYRNSKLTQILKDSLGNGSKVLLLVHITPSEEDVGETICSLMFANRARAVEINREPAEDVSKEKQKRISVLEQDMRQAEEECHKVQDQVHKAALLLTESKKSFLETYHQLPEHKEQPLETPQNDSKGTNRTTPAIDDSKGTNRTTPPIDDSKGTNRTTPPTDDKENKRKMSTSQPRFMISTVASRQRQSAVEKEVTGRPGRMKSWNRSPVHHFPSSKSFSSESHLKLWNRSPVHFPSSKSFSSGSNLKSIIRESNKKYRHGDTASMSHMVTLSDDSDPNFRTTLSHHRRRMSDLV